MADLKMMLLDYKAAHGAVVDAKAELRDAELALMRGLIEEGHTDLIELKSWRLEALTVEEIERGEF